MMRETEYPHTRPHQRSLRFGRKSEQGRAYSLTKCTKPGVSLIGEPCVSRTLIDTLFWMNDHGRFVLGAFVIMPDHFHMVVSLSRASLQDIMRQIGSFTARKINEILGKSGPVWQSGYYDRGIRKRDDLLEVIDYVHNNPVRKGLAAKPEEWPYSSLNPEYHGSIQWGFFM